MPQNTVLLLAVRCLSPMSRFPLSNPLNKAEQSYNISLTLQYSRQIAPFVKSANLPQTSFFLLW
jgi:hypothetical protein